MLRVLAPLVVAVSITLLGCSRAPTAVQSANRDQVLLLGNKDEPADMDPNINTATSTSTLLSALFEGLVRTANDGKTILPGVADSWEISPDGLTYTFHLQPGAQWSNGQPLTASQFRDSLVRVFDPAVGCENAGYGFAIRGARAFFEGKSTDPASIGVSAPDDRTLVMVLEHPAPYQLALLSSDPFYPVYMPSLDANGGRKQRGGPWTRPGVLVGNGPFSLAEWRPNAFLRVVRNPHYWDASRVRLREVRFFPTDEEGAEERAFRAGQLHVTYRLPKAKFPTYSKDHPGELHLSPVLRTQYLVYNTQRAPFGDVRVRRALALALDREQLVRATMGAMATPAYSIVRPRTGGLDPGRPFHSDPAGAAALLAEAGYPGGRGLPAIELTLNGNTSSVVEFGEALVAMWQQRLGVRVTLAPMEFKAYLSADRERQFQLLLEGNTYIDDPRDMLGACTSNDPNNDAGGSDAALDAAFRRSEYTLDPAARAAAFQEMERILEQDGFYTPLFYLNRAFLVDPSVHGWRDNPRGIIDWREVSVGP